MDMKRIIALMIAGTFIFAGCATLTEKCHSVFGKKKPASEMVAPAVEEATEPAPEPVIEEAAEPAEEPALEEVAEPAPEAEEETAEPETGEDPGE